MANGSEIKGKEGGRAEESNHLLSQVGDLLRTRTDLLFHQAARVAFETGTADKTFGPNTQESSVVLRTGPEGRVVLGWSPRGSVALTRYDGNGDTMARIAQLQKPKSSGTILELEFDGNLVKVETAPRETGSELGVSPLTFQGDWAGEFRKMKLQAQRKRRVEITYPNLRDTTGILAQAMANPYLYVDALGLAREFLEGLFE